MGFELVSPKITYGYFVAMQALKQVEKPVKRGRLRKYLGKRYFIAKRRWLWLRNAKHFANTKQSELLEHQIFEHSSILLRPLKDVDMQYQHNKIQNLRLAIEKLDGIVINPGETFSLWYLVGNPSKRRGYLKGLVLSNGQIGYDYGGGLCQMGNLIYWMVLHSALTVTERWRHGFDVFPDVNRKLPFGSGATLSYNYIDLQIKNETLEKYQLNLYLSDERLHGGVYSDAQPKLGYNVFESDHAINHEFWGGYTRHNRLKRKVTDASSKKELREELITENHAIMMYEPLIAAAKS